MWLIKVSDVKQQSVVQCAEYGVALDCEFSTNLLLFSSVCTPVPPVIRQSRNEPTSNRYGDLGLVAVLEVDLSMSSDTQYDFIWL